MSIYHDAHTHLHIFLIMYIVIQHILTMERKRDTHTH